MSAKKLEIIEQLPGSYLNKCRAAARCPEDEALVIWLKGMVRLDDPVVTGLVRLVRSYDGMVLPALDAEKAIFAYEARVKEVSRE